MFITRRLRQPIQPFIKCRAFSADDFLDTQDVDSDAEEESGTAAKKVKALNKKKNKSIAGVNPKQRLENLQTFYDAAEASLK